MAVNSVNTNVQANAALQALDAVGRDLATTSRRVATGRRIGSAKDNGAIHSIATMQGADINALNAVKDSLSRGRGAVDVALAAGEQIVDLLTKMKSLALAGTQADIDRGSRKALENDYNNLKEQMLRTLGDAEFDGVNLLTSSQTFRFLASADGQQTVDIEGLNAKYTPFTPTYPFRMRGHSLDEVQYAKLSLEEVGWTLDGMTSALAKLATQGEALDTQMTFVGKLQDVTSSGVGNLVDADMGKESAKLVGLQTRQSLATQALAIATTSANWLKDLFRGR